MGEPVQSRPRPAWQSLTRLPLRSPSDLFRRSRQHGSQRAAAWTRQSGRGCRVSSSGSKLSLVATRTAPRVAPASFGTSIATARRRCNLPTPRPLGRAPWSLRSRRLRATGRPSSTCDRRRSWRLVPRSARHLAVASAGTARLCARGLGPFFSKQPPYGCRAQVLPPSCGPP